jgi:predicted RNA methylase
MSEFYERSIEKVRRVDPLIALAEYRREVLEEAKVVALGCGVCAVSTGAERLNLEPVKASLNLS